MRSCDRRQGSPTCWQAHPNSGGRHPWNPLAAATAVEDNGMVDFLVRKRVSRAYIVGVEKSLAGRSSLPEFGTHARKPCQLRVLLPFGREHAAVYRASDLQ